MTGEQREPLDLRDGDAIGLGRALGRQAARIGETLGELGGLPTVGPFGLAN